MTNINLIYGQFGLAPNGTKRIQTTRNIHSRFRTDVDVIQILTVGHTDTRIQTLATHTDEYYMTNQTFVIHTEVSHTSKRWVYIFSKLLC